MKLSDEAIAFFTEQDCQVELSPRPDAIQQWNEAKKSMIDLFHVTG